MPNLLEKAPDIKDKRLAISELLENGLDNQAESQIKELLAQSPDDHDLINALGSIYAQRGQFSLAEDHFIRAIALNPNFSDCHYNLGLVYSRTGKTAEAIEEFLIAAKLNPFDFTAHNDLGAMYHAQGKTLLAKGHFVKALEANPLYKPALMNLFEICWDYGTYSEGLSWVEKYLQNVKTSPSDENAMPPTDKPRITEKISIPAASYGPNRLPSSKKTIFVKKGSSSTADELFLRHVPKELYEKKTGMNIAVVADYNIAGQLSLLFRMINRHTIHKARMIILQGDYLSYDKDIILSENIRSDYDRAMEIIRKADFYHVGRFPVNFGEINWNDILKPDNAIVQYYGSEIRNNPGEIYNWHIDRKIHGISAWDYTMLENAPLFYHVNIMCDLSAVKAASPPQDAIRICHPSTNRSIKHTDLFLDVVGRLKKKYPLEIELIEGKTNEECLEIKSRCHITYDQISVGIYGLSAIESMAAGHVVLGGISNFASSYHPDNPIVYVNEDNFYEKLEYLLKHKGDITAIGNAGKNWVRQHHDPHKIIRQYAWLYDFVANGHRIVDSVDACMIRKDDGFGY